MVTQQLHVRQTVRELKREGGGMAELALPGLEGKTVFVPSLSRKRFNYQHQRAEQPRRLQTW